MVAVVAGLAAAFSTERAAAERAFLLKQLGKRTTVPTDIETVIAEEEVRGREFARLMDQRIRRDVATAMSIPDPAQREAAVRGVMQREQVYARYRAEAMASRAFAAVDRMVLRRESPTGAFWLLDPTVKEHTAGCLILGGRFWPWSVLDRVHPPRHAGCPCRLISYAEAVKRGLLHAGAVMDEKDAIKAAASVVMEAQTYLAEFDLEERESWKTQPRDPGGEDGGRWVKGGAGGAAAAKVKAWAAAVPQGRTAPASGSTAEKVTDFMAGWSHEGTSTRLTSVYTDANGQTRIEGKFVRGGEDVGEFKRNVKPDGAEVYHDAIQASKGSSPGHATQFVRDSEAAYPAMGINTVSLSASWSKGGYKWAREGYGFDERHGSVADQLDAMWTERGWYVLNAPESSVPKGLREEFERKIKAHEFKHPFELAAFGADHPFTYSEGGFPGAPERQFKSWLGRLFMEGNEWYGVKHLS